jgi:hypothetical protein
MNWNTFTNKAVLFLVIFLACSCKKDQPPTALDIFKKQLIVAWKINSASLDGKDVTSYYPNLTITFDATSFSTANGVMPLWKPTMNFSIEGTSAPFHIVREDGIDMTVVSVDGSKLILEFQYDAAKLGGRTQSVSGNYHFEFLLK